MREPVEVFRSPGRRACEERAFMLMAVGIDSEIDAHPDGHALMVEHPMRAHAIHHLHHYEQERRALPPARFTFTPRPDPWRGSFFYVLLLLIPPIALSQGWLPFNPYDGATLDPALVRGGEWWRAITALTLHWDAPHLLGNLGGGALLGYSASQVWGNARAWLLILVAAVMANFLEAFIAWSSYRSAGASTAVFAALGLTAAFAWRARGQRFGSPWVRWAPLIAGVALLGFFGAGSSVPVAGMPQPQELPFLEEQGVTNVLSHLLGFVCGVAVGAFAATGRGARVINLMPAWSAVLLTLAPLAIAWGFVLMRAAH